MNLVPLRRRHCGRLVSLPDAVSDMFDRFFDDGSFAPERSYVPPIDIVHGEDALTIKAELPGMKADDVQLSVHGDTLTLSGEKKDETEKSDGNCHHVERRYGSFQRRITLPADVDADKIEAHCTDGVLTVVLPKSEKAKAKRIAVRNN